MNGLKIRRYQYFYFNNNLTKHLLKFKEMKLQIVTILLTNKN